MALKMPSAAVFIPVWYRFQPPDLLPYSRAKFLRRAISFLLALIPALIALPAASKSFPAIIFATIPGWRIFQVALQEREQKTTRASDGAKRFPQKVQAFAHDSRWQATLQNLRFSCPTNFLAHTAQLFITPSMTGWVSSATYLAFPIYLSNCASPSISLRSANGCQRICGETYYWPT